MTSARLTSQLRNTKRNKDRHDSVHSNLWQGKKRGGTQQRKLINGILSRFGMAGEEFFERQKKVAEDKFADFVPDLA